MRIGRLRTKIEVKDFSNTPYPDGSPNETWEVVHTLMGNVIWLRGKTYFDSYELGYEIKGRAFIRFRSDLHRDMRLGINGDDYDIESIMPVDNKRRELEIVFKAVSA